jgi:hypothetical protein
MPPFTSRYHAYARGTLDQNPNQHEHSAGFACPQHIRNPICGASPAFGWEVHPGSPRLLKLMVQLGRTPLVFESLGSVESSVSKTDATCLFEMEGAVPTRGRREEPRAAMGNPRNQRLSPDPAAARRRPRHADRGVRLKASEPSRSFPPWPKAMVRCWSAARPAREGTGRARDPLPEPLAAFPIHRRELRFSPDTLVEDEPSGERAPPTPSSGSQALALAEKGTLS